MSVPRFRLDGMRRHKLITAGLARKLPPIHSQAGKGMEAVAFVKLFSMMSGRLTIYITEFDGVDELYGYTFSPLGPDCDEWGYSSLSYLAELSRGILPLIERDRFFTPTRIGDFIKPVEGARSQPVVS